jgi:hypothetical protein
MRAHAILAEASLPRSDPSEYDVNLHGVLHGHVFGKPTNCQMKSRSIFQEDLLQGIQASRKLTSHQLLRNWCSWLVQNTSNRLDQATKVG